MQRHNWLALVAVHSDVWLMSVAFYFGARLDKHGRATLFDSINDYPTCFELVTGRAQPSNPRKRAAPSGGAARARPAGRAGGSRGRYDDDDDAYDDDGGYGEEDDGGDEGGDPCPNCGRRCVAHMSGLRGCLTSACSGIARASFGSLVITATHGLTANAST